MTQLSVSSIGPSLFLSPTPLDLVEMDLSFLVLVRGVGGEEQLPRICHHREWCTSAVEHKGLTAAERRLSSRSYTFGQIVFLASELTYKPHFVSTYE